MGATTSRQGLVSYLLARGGWRHAPEVASARLGRAVTNLNAVLAAPPAERVAALLRRTASLDVSSPVADPGFGQRLIEWCDVRGGPVEDLGELGGFDEMSPDALAALADALAGGDPAPAPPPADEPGERAPFVPGDAGAPAGPDLAAVLAHVQHLVHEERDEGARADGFRALAAETDDVRCLQVIAAGVVAVAGDEQVLDAIRAKAGGARVLGVPAPAWSETPAATTQIGSADGEPDERPVRDVTLPTLNVLAIPYTEALHLVVARQPVPEVEDDGTRQDLREPHAVSWVEANDLLAKWTRVLPGRHVRLPAEAEWESFCRAGTTTPWWTGDDPAELARAAHFAAEAPSPVAQREANAWKLHDVHGGIWEWCADEYAPYAAPTAHDGRRVARGGCWSDTAPALRSANREAFRPDREFPHVGMRPLLAAGTPPSPVSGSPLTPSPTAPAPGGGNPPPPPPPGGGGGGGGRPMTGGTGVAADAVPGKDAIPDGTTRPPRPVTGVGSGGGSEAVAVGSPAGVATGDGDGDCCCVCCDEIRTAQPGGDVEEGQLTPEEEEIVDEVVDGAEKEKAEGDGAENHELDEDAAGVADAGKQAADELERREDDPERRRVEEERRRIEEEGKRIGEEQAELDEDRREAARNQERIDELRAEERAYREAGLGAEAERTKATREALEGRASRDRADLDARQQRLDQMRASRDARVDRLESALDRGYGLTREEHASRTADRRLRDAQGQKARIDNLLDLLREQEAAQGGLSADDRALRGRLERESARMGGRIEGDIDAAQARMRDAVAARDHAQDVASASVDARQQIETAHRAGDASDQQLADARRAEADAKDASDRAQQTFNRHARDFERDQSRYTTGSLRGRAERARVAAAFGDSAADEWSRDTHSETEVNDRGASARVADAGRRLRFRELPSDDLRAVSWAAQDATTMLDSLRQDVGRPGARRRIDAEAGRQLAAARARVDAIQARSHDAAAELDRLDGVRRDASGRLASARAELQRLGHSEFSVPSGPDRDRVETLQDDVRGLRPEVRRTQEETARAAAALRDAQREIPGAEADVFRASPLGIASLAQDRVLARNDALAPWVGRDGQVDREAVRAAAARQLLELERLSNARAQIARLERARQGGADGPGIDEELRVQRAAEDRARRRLHDAGWSGTDDGRVSPDAESLVGAGFNRTFQASRIAARRAADEARRAAAYQTPEDVARRIREQGAAAFGSLGEGPTAGVAAAQGDAAASSPPSWEAALTVFSSGATGSPSEAGAVDAALRGLGANLPPTAFQTLLRDATAVLGGEPHDPVDVVRQVFALLESSARRTEGLDGVARVAMQRADALGDLVQVRTPPLGTADTAGGAAWTEAEDAYRAAQAEAQARLEELARAATLRGQDGRARSVEALAAAIRVQRQARAGTLDPAAAETELARIRDVLGSDAQIARVSANVAAERAGATTEQDRRKDLLAQAADDRDRAAALDGIRTHALSTIVRGVATQLARSPTPAAVAIYRGVNLDLADVLAEDRDRAREGATREGVPESERERLERDAERADLLRAYHQIEGGDFDGALQVLEAAPGDEATRPFRLQLAQLGYARMEQDAADAGLVTEDARDDWLRTEDRFLAVAERAAAEPGTAGSAAATRAAIAVVRGDIDLALDHLGRALEKLPRDPRLVATRLGLLLRTSLGPGRRQDLFATLARVPAAEAAAIDEAAFQVLARSLPEAELAAVADSVRAAPPELTAERREAWLLRLETLELYRDLEEGLGAAAAHQRAQTILARVDLSGLAPDEAAGRRATLSSGIDAFVEYRTMRDAFRADPLSVAADDLGSFARRALDEGDVRLASDVLARLARAGGIPHGGRLRTLVDAAARLRAAEAAGSLAPDEAAAVSATRRRLAALGDEVRLDAIAEESAALATASAQRADAQSELAERPWLVRAGLWLLERPRLLEASNPALSLSGTPLRLLGRPTVADELSRTAKAIESARKSRDDVLAAVERFHRDRLGRISDLHAQLVQDAFGEEDGFTEERAAAARRLAEGTEALVERDRGLAGSGAPGARAAYFESLARLRAAQAELDAWQTVAWSRHVVPDGEPASSAVDRGAEDLVREGIDTLFGPGGTPGGLYAELVAIQSETDPDEATRRRVHEVRARIEDVEVRLQRWIFQGPIVDPSTGRTASGAYRMALFAGVVDERRLRALAASRATRDATRSATWSQLAEDERRRQVDDPALLAYLAVRGDAFHTETGAVDVARFARTLVRSLNAMASESHRELNRYYFPDSVWDWSAPQVLDAVVADWVCAKLDIEIDVETGDSLDAALWRIERLEREVLRVQAALLKVVSGERIESGSDEWRTLQRLGILRPVPDGYTLHVPDDLSLASLRGRLRLPEKTVWHDVLSVRTLTEVGVTLAIGGLLGAGIGAASVRIAGILARAGTAGRVLSAIARSPTALRVLGVVREAAAFTGAGRLTTRFMQGVGGARPGVVVPETSLLAEFGHNLLLFGALEGLSPLLRLSRANPQLEQTMRDLQSYLRTGRAAPVLGSLTPAAGFVGRLAERARTVWAWAASGVAATGIDSVLTGQSPTAESLARNLLVVPGIPRLTAALGHRILFPRAMPALGGLRPVAPVRGAKVASPAADAAARARYGPAAEAVRSRGSLDAPIDAADRERIRQDLASARIDVEWRAGDGTPSFARMPSGRERLVLHETTTRLRALEELSKAQAARGLRISAEQPFTSELEALVERDGFRILRDEHLQAPGREADRRRATGLAILWNQRLGEIRAGLRPNLVLHAPGDGLRVFSGRPGRTGGLRVREVRAALEALTRGERIELDAFLDAETSYGPTLEQFADWSARLVDDRSAAIAELGTLDPATQTNRVREIADRIDRIDRELAAGTLRVHEALEAIRRRREGGFSALRDPAPLTSELDPADRAWLGAVASDPRNRSVSERRDLLAWARDRGILDVEGGTADLSRAADPRLRDALARRPDVAAQVRMHVEDGLALSASELATLGIPASAVALIRDAQGSRLFGEQHGHLEASLDLAHFLTGARGGDAEAWVAALSDSDAPIPGGARPRYERLGSLLANPRFRARLDELAAMDPPGLVLTDGRVATNGRRICESADRLRSALAHAAALGPEAGRIRRTMAELAVLTSLSAFQESLAFHLPPEMRLRTEGERAIDPQARFFNAFLVLKWMVQRAVGGRAIDGRSAQEMLGTRPSDAALGYSEIRVAARDADAFAALVRAFDASGVASDARVLTCSMSKNVAATGLTSSAGFDRLRLVRLVETWFADPTLARLVGLDCSGTESAGKGPELMWAPYARRTVLNAAGIGTALRALPSGEAAAVRTLAAQIAERLAPGRGARLAEILARVQDDAGGARGESDWASGHDTFVEALGGATDGVTRAARRFVEADGARFLGATLAELAWANRMALEAMRTLGIQAPRQFGATAHAGEQLAARSGVDPFTLLADVRNAIRLGVDRVGHAVVLGIETPVLARLRQWDAPAAAQFDRLRAEVLVELAATGVVVEVNVSSNLRISNLALAEHPAARLTRERVRLSVSTDDEAVLATTIQREMLLYAALPGVRVGDVIEAALTAFDARMGAHPLANAAGLASGWRGAIERAIPDPARRLAAAESLAARFLAVLPTRGGMSDAAWTSALLDRTLAKVFGVTP